MSQLKVIKLNLDRFLIYDGYCNPDSAQIIKFDSKEGIFKKDVTSENQLKNF